MLRSRLRILDLSPNSNMESMKLQSRANSLHKPHLFARNPKTPTTRSNILIFGSIAVSLALFCYIFTVSNGYRYENKKKYSIVIDGGSTGTRVHVFEYDIGGNGVARFDFGPNGLTSMRVSPGLSAYVDDVDGAGRSVAELLDFAKRRVPRKFWGETEIRLMATAGMRMVDSGIQGEILESCRRVLEASGFVFQSDWASVITGSDEGLYAWVVANYALGTLGGDPLSTTGIIELGGASAQVTFVTTEAIPTEYSRIVRYRNITYNLYSHSLLQFGQNVAFDLLHESLVTKISESAAIRFQRQSLLDPCTPSGYSHDTKTIPPVSEGERSKYLYTLHPRGNFSECRSAALALLQKGKEKCVYEHCYIGSTFIPKLQGKFLATENFFHTGKFFELDQRAYISGLMGSGKEFCENDWSKLRKKYTVLGEDDLRRYCFSSAYIVALLHDSLGIAIDDERIGFANQVQDIPLDWALGAFILQSSNHANTDDPNWISTSGNGDSSSTLMALFAVAIILMFCAWSLSKWKKPHVKTIFDLEKGKYIVSRYQ